MPEFNILAVIAAALATFVLGGLWYSPALFGRAWQREAGVTEPRDFDRHRNTSLVVFRKQTEPWVPLVACQQCEAGTRRPVQMAHRVCLLQ